MIAPTDVLIAGFCLAVLGVLIKFGWGPIIFLLTVYRDWFKQLGSVLRDALPGHWWERGSPRRRALALTTGKDSQARQRASKGSRKIQRMRKYVRELEKDTHGPVAEIVRKAEERAEKEWREDNADWIALWEDKPEKEEAQKSPKSEESPAPEPEPVKDNQQLCAVCGHRFINDSVFQVHAVLRRAMGRCLSGSELAQTGMVYMGGVWRLRKSKEEDLRSGASTKYDRAVVYPGEYVWSKKSKTELETVKRVAEALIEDSESIPRPIIAGDRYCRFEASGFPASEFSVDPTWGIVHEVNPRHTFMGDLLDDMGDLLDDVDSP